MKIVSLTNASSVLHPVHGTATVGADGAFELAEDFAADLLRFPAQWATDDTFLGDTEASVSVPALYDPTLAAEVLAQLREDVATLIAGGTVSDPAPTSPVGVPANWRPNRWHPDLRTLGLASMHVRNDQAALTEFYSLLVQLDDAQVTP